VIISRPVFRPAFWPTIITAAALLVLLGLGTWQVERLAWKRGLIAERHAALEAPAVPLPATLDEARRLEFRNVAVTGEFLHDKELYLAATNDLGTVGKHVFTPFRLADGRVLLVNRGYVTDAKKDPATRAEGQVAGPVELVGRIRLAPEGKPHWFVPDNRPDLNFWFYPDLAAMARAAGLPGVLPFYLDAGPAPNPGGWPKGGVTRLDNIPNNHLQYAITWYALALALVTIYVLYHTRRGDPEKPGG
jgi:surfeit locus 1 family protein